MQARMKHPVVIVPDAMKALPAQAAATKESRVPWTARSSSSTCAQARSTAAAPALTCTRALPRRLAKRMSASLPQELGARHPTSLTANVPPWRSLRPSRGERPAGRGDG